MPTQTDKADIRRDIRGKLKAMGATGRQAASSKIAAHLSTHLAKRLPAGGCVLGFWPLTRSEPDIRPALVGALGSALGVALPRTDGDRLIPHRLTEFDALVRSPIGVREPSPVDHETVDPSTLDLVLVPGVAFTRSGWRLGRGGGHYDRFLARLPPHVKKIGVAFEAQLLAELPLEPHDIAVDVVITEADSR